MLFCSTLPYLFWGWRRYKDLHEEVEVRRKAEERARELAERDALTGCLNRRSGPAAIEHLRATLEGTHREIAVMMIDLDNFKQINDLNGHQMGDRILTTVARRVRRALPEGGILARIGGDEFVCAVPFVSNARGDVDDLVAVLIDTVSAPIDSNQMTVETTVSVGISQSGSAFTTPDCSDADALIHRADIAMHQARKRGRNRFYWFEPQM